MSHIYLAAPLFTVAEQNFNLSLAEYLTSKGFAVFLPQSACTGKEGRDIYITCLEGLAAATIVVAILDGADADSGTCWECGYACAKGIPVIGVRTDFRGTGDVRGFNAMLFHSATRILEGTEQLFSEIATALTQLGQVSKPQP
jgi:nucleoside 2-deoxyribosyltransferase